MFMYAHVFCPGRRHMPWAPHRNRRRNAQCFTLMLFLLKSVRKLLALSRNVGPYIQSLGSLECQSFGCIPGVSLSEPFGPTALVTAVYRTGGSMQSKASVGTVGTVGTVATVATQVACQLWQRSKPNTFHSPAACTHQVNLH